MTSPFQRDLKGLLDFIASLNDPILSERIDAAIRHVYPSMAIPGLGAGPLETAARTERMEANAAFMDLRNTSVRLIRRIQATVIASSQSILKARPDIAAALKARIDPILAKVSDLNYFRDDGGGGSKLLLWGAVAAAGAFVLFSKEGRKWLR